jgi:hypothetical protein
MYKGLEDTSQATTREAFGGYDSKGKCHRIAKPKYCGA